MTQMVSHFEQTQVGLGTVLQDAEKGKELFEDLRKFSFDTTFGVDELASASTQLLNVGVSARELQGDLKMLGDLAGGNKGKFAELTEVFAKINSSGKATSMQLQQIANRGIPINQTLKQMGVTGTASAQQITEAFKKLTAEGGQFHDAMNNIIDTIEGKEGFITDTFKEILVNFSDASGVTDLYKSLLDGVYNALAFINDGLAEINKNPLLKALLRGALVMGITMLVGVIIGSLIPALTTVIASLTSIATLQAMINPVALIGLGIGALVAGISLISNSESEVEKETKKANKELQEQINKLKELHNEQIKDTSGQYSDVDKIKTREELLQKELELAKNKYKLEKSYADENGTSYDEYGMADVELRMALAEVRDYEEQLNELQHSMSYYLAKSEEAHNKWLDDTIAKLENDYKNAQNDIATAWADMDEAKIEQLDAEYQKFKKIADMTATSAEIVTDENGNTTLKYSNNMTEQEVEKTNKILSKIEKELADAKIKTWKEGFESVVSDYQSYVLNQIGVNIETELAKVANHETSSYFTAEGKFKGVGTEDLLSKALNSNYYKYQTDTLKDINPILGVTGSDFIKSQMDNLNKSINSLVQYADVQGDYDNKTFRNTKGYNEYYDSKSQSWKQANWNVGDLKVDQIALKKYTNELVSKVKEYYTMQRDELLKTYNKSESLADYQQNILASQLGMTRELYEETRSVREESEKLQKLATAKTLSEYADAIGGHAGTALSGIDSAISGTDIGTLVNNFMDSDKSKIDALIDTFITLIVDVIGGIEGVGLIFNFISNALKEFEPLLKTLMLFVYGIVKVLQPLAKLLMDFLNWITGGFFDDLAESWDELVSAQKSETENIKKLNEQYQNLYNAMVEQEEYYMSMKKQINSDSYTNKAYSVNDMILTPNGTFSTHPEDTIMAMKHPEQLMGSGTVVIQPVINNNMSESADVSVEQRTNENGLPEMIVTISKKIASDVARGVNGWDSAFALRDNRLQGSSRM